MIGRFVSELTTVFPGWKSRLRADPGHWPEIEQEVHAAFRRGTDLVGVGFMAELNPGDIRQPA
ncbi:MAG: hypothetical protein NT069_24450 [Planctomycetota bacterium]|nr:hypothetical protein [Planctomycetota bacterium]